MTKASDSPNKMTAREAAAVQLKVPNSGCAWLDEMIKEARDLDAEQFQAKLKEPTVSYQQAAGRAKRPKKEPELRDQKD